MKWYLLAYNNESGIAPSRSSWARHCPSGLGRATRDLRTAPVPTLCLGPAESWREYLLRGAEENSRRLRAGPKGVSRLKVGGGRMAEVGSLTTALSH